MKTLNEIKSAILTHKKEIEKKFNIKKIGIFGSWVKGKQHKRSDIDIVVEFNQAPDLFLLIDLEEYLKKILQKKVDLVRLSAIREEIKEQILKEVIFL